MHKDLLEYYHKENAFITIKLMSKEEMLLSAYGEFLKDAIPFLMKKEKINYSNAISILKYLPYVNSAVDETTAYLLNLKRELNDNGLIRINKYIDYELQNSEIFIHGYSDNDKELLYFIKTRKLQVHFINSKKEPPKYTYKHFENGDVEVFSVLNNIAKLIDGGIDINCISIVAKNK